MKIIPTDYLSNPTTPLSSPTDVKGRLTSTALRHGIIDQESLPTSISERASLTSLHVDDSYKVRANFEVHKAVSWKYLSSEPFCWTPGMIMRAYIDLRTSFNNSTTPFLSNFDYMEQDVPVSFTASAYLNDLCIGQADINRYDSDDRDLAVWSKLAAACERGMQDSFSSADVALSALSSLVNRVNTTYQSIRKNPDTAFFRSGDFAHYQGATFRIDCEGFSDQFTFLSGIMDAVPISEITHVVYPSGSPVRNKDAISGASDEAFSDHVLDVRLDPDNGVPIVVGAQATYSLTDCALQQRAEIRHGDSVYSVARGVHGTVLGICDTEIDLLLSTGELARTERHRIKRTPVQVRS